MAEKTEKTPQKLIEELFKNCGPIITRPELGRLTTGIISAGSIANLDAAKKGIPGSFMLNGKRAYPTKNAQAWLIAKVEKIS